jgi:hypothetical protein
VTETKDDHVTEREPAEQPHSTTTSDESELRKEQETPGDAAGVPVPSEHAAPGTSQEFSAVDGVLTYPDESPAPGDTFDEDVER